MGRPRSQSTHYILRYSWEQRTAVPLHHTSADNQAIISAPQAALLGFFVHHFISPIRGCCVVVSNGNYMSTFQNVVYCRTSWPCQDSLQATGIHQRKKEPPKEDVRHFPRHGRILLPPNVIRDAQFDCTTLLIQLTLQKYNTRQNRRQKKSSGHRKETHHPPILYQEAVRPSFSTHVPTGASIDFPMMRNAKRTSAASDICKSKRATQHAALNKNKRKNKMR